MGIHDVIDGKRQWRAHMARVRALPPDYQIVYREIQRYFFKAGTAGLHDAALLSGIADFFEEGAAASQGVLELIGSDVAAFCDDRAGLEPRRGQLPVSDPLDRPARQPPARQPPTRQPPIRQRPAAAPRWPGCSS